jgi:hypothetical protein
MSARKDMQLVRLQDFLDLVNETPAEVGEIARALRVDFIVRDGRVFIPEGLTVPIHLWCLRYGRRAHRAK